MKKIIVIFLSIIVIVFILAISFRIRKDIHKKLNFANTYAIQNTSTGNNIRVYNANTEDGTQIISYNPKNWECITWEFIKIDENTFLLKNLYTEKTFQPAFSPKDGVGLIQKSMGGTRLQYWEFLKQSNGNYLIRLKDTEFYLKASSEKIDSPIILTSKKDETNLQWKLIRQNPWI